MSSNAFGMSPLARPTRPSGFTLIEIIIATSIALFVFGVGYQAIASTVSSNNITSARIRDTENARLFFDLLQRDMSTAFPGPTYMKKNSIIIPSAAYTPESSANPLVLNENVGLKQISILQFYCRTDQPGDANDAPEPYLFVRYGFNHSATNSLCRQTVTWPPPPPAPVAIAPDADGINYNALDFTGNTQQGELCALFDNVTNLKISFQQWDPVNRKYIKELDPGFNYASADSLLVTLTFGDVRNSQVGVTSTTNINRTYSKVIPIPASLK